MKILNRFCHCLTILASLTIGFSAWAGKYGEKARSEKCVRAFAADAAFLTQVKDIPQENISSTFEDYSPKNESQKVGLETAEKLVAFDGEKSIGAFLSGPPGVGKTHLAIAVAREATKRHLRVLFLTPETHLDFKRKAKKAIDRSDINHPDLRLMADLAERRDTKYDVIPTEEGLSKFDLVIFDDLNPKNYLEFVSYKNLFKEVVIWAHRLPGKKIFVTSNSSLSKVIDAATEYSSSERLRLEDRVRTLFVERQIEGSSQRPSANWTD